MDREKHEIIIYRPAEVDEELIENFIRAVTGKAKLYRIAEEK